MAKNQQQSHTGGITSWLSKPFPALETVKEKLSRAAIIGATVFLILLILKPYGVSVSVLPIATIYGATSFFVVMCYELLTPKLFPKLFNTQQWTIGKNIVSTIVNISVIALLNWVVSCLLDSETIPGKSFQEIVVRTISVSLTPVIIITWMTEKKLYKERHKTAAEISEAIKDPAESTCPPVSLQSDGNRTPLDISCHELLYATSEGNYVQLYRKNPKGTIESHTLRITLKSLLSQFTCCESIVQCHRSYLVNLSHIDRVTGNARGYTLHSKYSEETVPVSRSKSELILKQLSA